MYWFIYKVWHTSIIKTVLAQQSELEVVWRRFSIHDYLRQVLGQRVTVVAVRFREAVEDLLAEIDVLRNARWAHPVVEHESTRTYHHLPFDRIGAVGWRDGRRSPGGKGVFCISVWRGREREKEKQAALSEAITNTDIHKVLLIFIMTGCGRELFQGGRGVSWQGKTLNSHYHCHQRTS